MTDDGKRNSRHDSKTCNFERDGIQPYPKRYFLKGLFDLGLTRQVTASRSPRRAARPDPAGFQLTLPVKWGVIPVFPFYDR